MKLFYLLPLLLIHFSCINKGSSSERKHNKNSDRIVLTDFQSILDSANVRGSILLYDLSDKKFYSNDFEWAQRGFLPASTFKITNSIIALETGVVEDDSTMFVWDGKPRAFKAWEQDLILNDAFHYSCVPCYQEVARKIGEDRMREYLSKLNYGSMVFDSLTIDNFWLWGKSRITQFQQIDFLKRLYESKLPIDERTERIMKKMMVVKENESYKLSGKTGWSTPNGKHNAWFVGFMEKDGKVVFFATNIEPGNDFNIDKLPGVRKNVTMKALGLFDK